MLYVWKAFCWKDMMEWCCWMMPSIFRAGVAHKNSIAPLFLKDWRTINSDDVSAVMEKRETLREKVVPPAGDSVHG